MTAPSTPPRSSWRATRDDYERASSIAKSKGLHAAPPGVLELPDNQARRYWPSKDDCGAKAPGDLSWSRLGGDDAAQLRSVYTRVVVKPEGARAWDGGKPAWRAIGVYCPKCGAFWAKPSDD